MKPTSRLLTAFLLLFPAALQAQQAAHSFTEANFSSQILSYKPAQRDGVTEDKYRRATDILEQTRSATKGDPASLNVSDFWNITTAFVLLQEPAENIQLAFSKAIDSDPKTVCDYLKTLGPSKLELLIPGTFLPFYSNCLQEQAPAANVDPAQYAAKNHLDIALVTQIQQIGLKDQQYRNQAPFDNARQQPLDLENQQAIDALYVRYKTYIGRSLVGKQSEFVMWAVIQHSNLEMMEKYLPVIQQAVAQKEIDSTPLKMLIDRIYSIRTKQQIFGSQGKFPLADDQTRARVRQQYGLD